MTTLQRQLRDCDEPCGRCANGYAAGKDKAYSESRRVLKEGYHAAGRWPLAAAAAANDAWCPARTRRRCWPAFPGKCWPARLMEGCRSVLAIPR